jgi:hypothetical protein
MLELIKKELDSLGAFNGELPNYLTSIVDSISNPLIPYRMKLSIAVSEVILFSSHLRRNILHWNGSTVPINGITFTISESGSGKDSSVNAARKCFNSGYKAIEAKRKEIARQQAIKMATLENRENPEDWHTYKEYYQEPNPLFIAPSTPEGFIQHLNDLDKAGTGGGFIYSGEFGSELASSSVLTENIKLLAELYDEGNKEVKVLKNRENQSKEIRNLPVSALFVGSQENILYDESVKKKFKVEFSTKLARRSFFNYNPEHLEPIQYSSVKEMLDSEIVTEELAVESRNKMDSHIKQIAEDNLSGIGQPLEITKEVRELFIMYKRYNEETSETIKAQYPISKLVRKHLQWKALKLAGALAIFESSNIIAKNHYTSAISYVEMLDNDMQLFEQELVKEPYEVFVDFMHKNATEGKHQVSLHILRKLGYIPKTGSPSQKIKELVHLASSYDKTGIYTACEEGVCYEEQVLTDIAGVSYLPCEGTKKERQKNCSEGYEFVEYPFEDMRELLENDLAYSPFRFKDGKRSKNNIIGGCKMLVLDIDDSVITDEECHTMLSDVNHHIARTSDPKNSFKFRILIELDSVVDICDMKWKHFTNSIAEELALKIDPLPKSQIFFSYSTSNVLSTLDAEPLETKPYIIKASEIVESKEKPKKLTFSQQKEQLDDEHNTFFYAFECKDGSGSRNLIRAARHAWDLGASKEEVIELMYRINDYWVVPMNTDRLEKTIISQIQRF